MKNFTSTSSKTLITTNINYIKARIFLLVFLLLASGQSCKNLKKPVNNKPVSIKNENFAEHIRTTEFRTPEQERLGFKLPPGFEITLFASEPDITKPINMEFDEKGRLWVTQSMEYPMAAAPEKGRDQITILEDKNGDGKADKFTHFAQDLNIPIGIKPVTGGAIAYSIPNVYFFGDKNKDDKADDKKILLGQFGYKDTHGMVSNLIRGFDGWIHACHGFTNTSTITGTDGDSITMTSGNTFRFKSDGSRVEQTTYGRVNPFGYTFDEWGYLYSIDCHTKPIYQLINGAEYPHFGKKAPGIGFAPEMMTYELGSTALSGLAYYQSDRFPEEYRNSFYSGDVVTCRINRNTMTFNGSSPQSKREEDFLISEDPWFRPVDVKIGPDGALYIADFYNRIIGHYEVSLDHPGRDRKSGRIWRITYNKNKAAKAKNWSESTIKELIKGLNHPDINTRLLIADQLVDRWKEKSIVPVTAMLESQKATNKSFVQGLWILKKLNALPESLLNKALNHQHPVIQVHAIKVLAEQKTLNSSEREKALQELKNINAHVKRAVAEMLGKFPHINNVEPLLTTSINTDSKDDHLKYACMLSLRDHLRKQEIMKQVSVKHWTKEQTAVLMSAILDVPLKDAASFALNYIQSNDLSEDKQNLYLEHIARYIDADQIPKAVQQVRSRYSANMERQYSMYKIFIQGASQRGIQTPLAIKNWGIDIADSYLKTGKPEQLAIAAEIAGEHKATALEPDLRKLLSSKTTDIKVRTAAAEALMNISPQKNIDLLSDVFNRLEEPAALREKVAGALSQYSSSKVYSTLSKGLPSANDSLKLIIASALANSPEGIDYLLQATKNNYINVNLLSSDLKLKERMQINSNEKQRKQFDEFTAGTKNEREERGKLIEERIAGFDPSSVTVESGKAVFVQNCSICHQVKGNGGMIGPQLDGIGNWGQKALTEKVLDPNRNISQAFRTYNISLKNGKTLTGLYRREEGEVVVFANPGGKEFSVPKNEIKERKASQYTLMPDHFSKVISKKEFDALLKYLLSVKE